MNGATCACLEVRNVEASTPDEPTQRWLCTTSGCEFVHIQEVQRLESQLAERDREIKDIALAVYPPSEVFQQPPVSAVITEITRLRADKELTTCEKCRHVFPYAHLSVPCPHCIIEEQAVGLARLRADGERLLQVREIMQHEVGLWSDASRLLTLAENLGIPDPSTTHPKLKVMLIRDRSLLDKESMELLAELAKEQEYQIWIERVGDADENAIVIEAGEVVGA